MNQQALVTGAAGFIGGRLVEALVDAGVRVRALVRPTIDAAGLESLGAEVIRGDLLDRSEVQRAARGCDRLYHLAAVRGRHRLAGREVLRINTAAAEAVAQAALAAGVGRVVFASTAGVYGVMREPPADERSATAPNTAYRESKLRCEQVFRRYADERGLPVVIARLSAVLGPRAPNWLGWFRDMAAGRTRIIGSGDRLVHLADVDDVVHGLCRCGEVEAIEGECYNIAGPEPLKITVMLHMIAEELNTNYYVLNLPLFPFYLYHIVGNIVYGRIHCELPRCHDCEFFLTDTFMSIAKARKELQYVPRFSTRDTIARTARWYREQGLLR